MARRFLDDRGKGALSGAVREVEAQSAAEVVVVVRERSGSYLHANLTAGILAANAVLWFQLFSPWEFSLLFIQVAPTLAGALVGLASAWMPRLQRALTPPRMREAWVRTAAHAAFHEQRVGLTRERTGVLVYISRLERATEVVADEGVRAVAPRQPWLEATECIRAAAAAGDPMAVATAIAALGPILAPALPRGEDDVNELPDEVGVA